MHITFRKIKPEDFEFLWRLHNAALKEYVTKTWGWDEVWQRRNFSQTFDPGIGEIIVVDELDAGFLWVNEHEAETVLVSIRLLPEFQNKGIGTKIIREILDSSKNPVRLQVLKVNPALNLYKRLGFKVFSENETHFSMRT